MTRGERIHQLRAQLRAGRRRIRQIVTFNHRRRRAIRRLLAEAAPRAGVDFAWSHPSVAALKDAGITFVARYLSHDPSKNLSPPERESYRKAGIEVIVVWESSGGRALEGEKAGRADAQVAYYQAVACGMPVDQDRRLKRPIYFAVDTDASWEQVAPYFAGAAAVLGRHNIGAYGGIRVVAGGFEAGAIGFAWQTYAWSNGQWDRRAQVQQYLNGQSVGGISVDLDRSTVVDFGQW
jgi:hypothetical protein